MPFRQSRSDHRAVVTGRPVKSGPLTPDPSRSGRPTRAGQRRVDNTTRSVTAAVVGGAGSTETVGHYAGLSGWGVELETGL